MSNFIPEKKKEITKSHVTLHDRFVLPIVVEGYELLMKELTLCKPKLIIALGNTALWALTGQWGIKHWRGSQLETNEGIIVIPTYPPSTVLRQWSLRPVVVNDLRRAAKVWKEGPVKRPDYRFIIRPSFAQAFDTLNSILGKLDLEPQKLSVDIETKSGHIVCIGFSWTKLDAICIPFLETQKGGAHYWPEWEESQLVHLMYRIMTHRNVRVIWQNGLYDAQYIYRAWHFTPRHSFDTMIGSHSCFSTMPKSLDFLASLYNNYYVQWKGVAKSLQGEHGNKKDD